MAQTGIDVGLGQKEVIVRIDSSVVNMESSRRYTSVTAKSVSASVMRRMGSLNSGLGSLNGGLGNLFGDLVSSDDNMGQTKQTDKNEENAANLEDITTHFKNLSNPGRISTRNTPENALVTIRQYCMQFLMELLFGFRGDRFGENMWGNSSDLQQNGTGSGTAVYQESLITNQFYHMESENTTFSTTGTVKTADGRELSFNLELSMSRRFEQYYEETYSTKVRYCDPLVINLDTNIAQVSDQKFFFDLDQDGTEEEISCLKSGSGFLALDLNGDGVINDGGELFGTKSGNGFADLSKYDSDGNGWIDEADEIWDKLLIWVKDDEGKDVLYHLSDLGVGAIGLGNVSTQFALNSAQDNHNNAMIRNTGIFLYENGNVSTVQHLDLAQ